MPGTTQSFAGGFWGGFICPQGPEMGLSMSSAKKVTLWIHNTTGRTLFRKMDTESEYHMMLPGEPWSDEVKTTTTVTLTESNFKGSSSCATLYVKWPNPELTKLLGLHK
jgi:hypothetical protein